MLMDDGMDTGPILAQVETAIGDDDTGGSLSAKLADAGARLLSDTLRRWLDGTLEPRPQDETRATVTRLLHKEDGMIDWTQSADQISRQIRAFNPWPGSYTTLAGAKLNVWQATPIGRGSASMPGEVMELEGSAGDPSIRVSTGDGLLGLIELQREGRRRVSAADFVRGTRELVGSRFG